MPNESSSGDTEAAREALRGNLERSLSRTPTIVEKPSGVDSLRLGGGFQHAVVMHEAADGNLTYNCVDTVEAAERFMFDGDAESEHAH